MYGHGAYGDPLGIEREPSLAGSRDGGEQPESLVTARLR